MSIDFEEISKKINTNIIGKPLYVYESVTSTNDVIRRLEHENGLTVIAKSQTNGRGRLGRSWASDEGGIYMSFMLTPPFEVSEIPVITVLAGLSVCLTIERYVPCGIKWPNDIVIDGKKVCGILAQGISTEGKTDAVIVGIGVNANTKNFTGDIEKTATSIGIECNKTINENDIICDILVNFEKLYFNTDKEKIMDIFKEKCITLNSDVTVHFHSEKEDIKGVCTGLLPDASIEVTKENGERIYVSSGEVSVRGIYGYAK